jgi:phosphoglucosamine mutase
MENRKFFGTDGVRGHVNFDPMTVELTVALGKALAVILKEQKERPRVVIGKDTRLSGYMFENALIAGLASMGVDTLMTGPLPTPGIAYITRAYRADAGIVISASHNAFSDNGIKIFNSDGFKFSDELEKRIEDLIFQNTFNPPPDDGLGKNTRIADADGRYIEFLKASFPKGRTLDGMNIFLDCAHGAAHRVAPSVFWELAASVEVRGNHPNGKNINHECGSLYPEVSQFGVREFNADVGISLDGDADRLIMVDEKGDVVDGDLLMALCARHLFELGELPNNCVVATVMTNLGVIEYLRRLGIEVYQSAVGDRKVLEEMLLRGAYLGGEQSGHLIFLKHNTTGDGILSALQVLAIIQESGKSLSQLVAEIPRYPQVLRNIPVVRKPPIENLGHLQSLLQEVYEELHSQGRILIRYSGTEPLCRVLIEGKEESLIEKIADKIEDAIEEEIGLCAGSQVT